MPASSQENSPVEAEQSLEEGESPAPQVSQPSARNFDEWGNSISPQPAAAALAELDPTSSSSSNTSSADEPAELAVTLPAEARGRRERARRVARVYARPPADRRGHHEVKKVICDPPYSEVQPPYGP